MGKLGNGGPFGRGSALPCATRKLICSRPNCRSASGSYTCSCDAERSTRAPDEGARRSAGVAESTVARWTRPQHLGLPTDRASVEQRYSPPASGSSHSPSRPRVLRLGRTDRSHRRLAVLTTEVVAGTAATRSHELRDFGQTVGVEVMFRERRRRATHRSVRAVPRRGRAGWEPMGRGDAVQRVGCSWRRRARYWLP